MLSYQDCVELSDLTEEEIEAIAEHEHLPEMAALEMGSYLVHTRGRHPDDQAHHSGRHRGGAPARTCRKVLQLKLVLKHFVDTHPDNPSQGMSGTGVPGHDRTRSEVLRAGVQPARPEPRPDRRAAWAGH